MIDLYEGASRKSWLGGVLPAALALGVVAVLWQVSSSHDRLQASDSIRELMAAIDKDDVGAVRRALDRGVQVDERECGTTPLLRAAELGRFQIAELLLERGASVGETDDFGSALAYAAINRAAVETVRLLLRHDADPNIGFRHGRTPLMVATLSNNVDAMKVLIEAGAEVDTLNRHGESALDIAREQGHADAQRLLLDAGAPAAHGLQAFGAETGLARR